MSLKMAKEHLKYAFVVNSISDEEFVLLNDINRSGHLVIYLPYRQYSWFNLDNMEDEECLA